MDIQLHQSKESLEVADAVFGVDYNEPLIHQIVTAYMSGARAGTKAQKTKGEVRGGGKKPWRQKGTGRARAGSIRSPLWRGGGVTFAAKPRDYSQKVNRKMYRGAMRSIVAGLARSGRLLVVESFALESPKTRDLIGKLAAVDLRDDVLLVTEGVEQNLYLSSRNLPKVDVCDVEALNPLSLLSFGRVLITAAAVKKLEARLS